MRVDILGVGFDPVDMDGALARLQALLDSPRAATVVTPNPEIVYAAQSDAELMRCLNEAELVLADGIGVVRAAETLGRPLPGRVPGVELAEELARRLAGQGKSLYLLGGKPGVPELAAKKLRERYPGLDICGVHDGYFTDGAAILEAIRAASPDVLMVCLGSPKQECWMRAHKTKVGSAVMLGLGGTIDIFAGTAKRAPALFRKLGLEWLYRIALNPSRWKRSVALPRFLYAVKRQKRLEAQRRNG